MVSKEKIIERLYEEFCKGYNNKWQNHIWLDIGNELGICKNLIKVEYGVSAGYFKQQYMGVYICNRGVNVTSYKEICDFIEQMWNNIEEVCNRIDKIKSDRKYYGIRWELKYEVRVNNKSNFEIVIDNSAELNYIISLISGELYFFEGGKELDYWLDLIEGFNDDVWDVAKFLAKRYPYTVPVDSIVKSEDGAIILHGVVDICHHEGFPIFYDKLFKDKDEYKIKDVKKFINTMNLLINCHKGLDHVEKPQMYKLSISLV